MRINKKIRIRQVRLIGENGEQMGLVATEDALRIATERGFDLVEVSPDAAPPVCKLMDYGKFKYQMRKKTQKAKKKVHVTRVKEIRLRPITELHDVMFKIKHARELLEKGDKVLFTVFFKGREIMHMERGLEMMKKIEEDLGDVAKPEAPMRREGSRLFLTVIKK